MDTTRRNQRETGAKVISFGNSVVIPRDAISLIVLSLVAGPLTYTIARQYRLAKENIDIANIFKEISSA
ncbi:MAG: hypothetical protein ABSE39_10375 [Candidatus Bathyarchaeia archaeon]